MKVNEKEIGHERNRISLTGHKEINNRQYQRVGEVSAQVGLIIIIFFT